MDIVIVGAGRAGSALALALARSGHHVRVVHHDDLDALEGADAVVLAVPDDAIAEVAAALPVGTYAVIHVAGSRGLDELAPHPRRALLHPLAALPDPEVGARRLAGARYSVAGDPVARDLVEGLGGVAVEVAPERRVAYHAAATVAANHTVALLGHLEALAEAAGLELADYLGLVGQAVEDVTAFGVERALTGPASRDDVATIDKHLQAVPARERPTYVALARAAFEVAERRRATV
jgi:predicted short-subunit dehydrogenase-like oxidoreductase (DUF2520 family)